MATEKVGVLVDIAVKGREGVRGAADDFKTLDKTTGTVKANFASLATSIAAGTAIIAGAAIAAKQLWGALKAGAAMADARGDFNDLTEAIGGTADAMLGKLREATGGLVTDAQLVADASNLMSLGLGLTKQQIIDFSGVAAQLDISLETLTDTLNTGSTRGLKEMGLSIDFVKTRMAELEAQGIATDEAFRMAILEAAEAKIDAVGKKSEEAAGQLQQLEVAVTDTKNQLSLMTIELANSTGFTAWLGNLAKNIELNRQLEEAYQAGKISWQQYENALIEATGPGKAAGALETLNGQLEDNNIVLLSNEMAWSAWANGVAINAAEAEAQATAAMTAIFRNIIATNGALTDWTAGAGAGMGAGMGTGPLVSKNPAIAWMNQATALYKEQDLARAREVGSLQASTRAYGSYTTAVNEADAALAAAQSRMASAFSAEVAAKPEDGLIDAAGIVNIEAANKALFEQAQAAGATAGQLALLGVATGQFTSEQAQAALKAAILGEKIKQLAAGVASGEISVGDATGGLDAFRQQLDAGQIQGAADSVASLATAADDLAANGPYVAEMSVEDKAAWLAINELQTALNSLTGNHYINLVTTTSGAGGTAGPEIVPNNSNGTVDKNLISGKSGGAAYNVSVVNYVDGRAVSRTALDDVTTDRIKAALNGVGMR